MRKLTKWLLMHADTACQFTFLFVFILVARVYTLQIAILGGVLLVLMMLYPQKYKEVKAKLFANL